MKKILIASAITAALSGCATGGQVFPPINNDGNYAKVMNYSYVTSNDTPYSPALQCTALETQGSNIRIAVGKVEDFTGTFTSDEGSRVTRGGSLMAISALHKAGVKQVERFDQGVVLDELRFAQDKLLGNPNEPGWKPVYAGQIKGSDYFLVGGITEVNFNIKSNSGEIKIPEVGIGARYAVMNIALDLRLIDSDTLEVVNVISRQKQILGRETKAGFFDFIGDTFTVAMLQGKASEPIQLGVRTVIESSVIELLAPIYKFDSANCIQVAEQKFMSESGVGQYFKKDTATNTWNTDGGNR